MATKPNLISILRARGVQISDSKAKKTSIATLEQMIAAREGCTYETSPDERDDAGLLTEAACFSIAEDWSLGKSHGAPEAGGFNHDETACIVTLTSMFQLEVDRTTGKVKKLRSPDADVRPARATRAAAHVNPLKPRASKGINIDPKPLGQQRTCRAHTCQALLIDALVGGATMHELRLCAPNWTDASIRSGLAYDVARIKGYGVRTEIMPVTDARKGHEASCEGLPDDATIQVYFLVLPAGMDKPLAHVEAAPVKMAANKT